MSFESERKPPGAVSRREYRSHKTGEVVVVWRGPGGRFLPGHRMNEVRDPSKLGREIVNPLSAVRRALGLPSNRHRRKA